MTKWYILNCDLCGDEYSARYKDTGRLSWRPNHYQKKDLEKMIVRIKLCDLCFKKHILSNPELKKAFDKRNENK